MKLILLEVINVKRSFPSRCQSAGCSHHDKSKTPEKDVTLNQCYQNKTTFSPQQTLKFVCSACLPDGWLSTQKAKFNLKRDFILCLSAPLRHKQPHIWPHNRHVINSASTWQFGGELRALDQDQRGSDGLQLACGEPRCRGRWPALAAEKTSI